MMDTHTATPRLDGYRIESLIARGGMGEVFLAWDERLERRVAIKRIRADGSDEQRRRLRFRREARAAARLSHPAIVQIFDVVATAAGEHIVMEHVEGSSLRALLGLRPLELGFAVRLAGEIAEGLAEAHSKGLVHRDLKAENVIVTPAGHAKILDFGLAFDLDDGGRGALTEPGALVGTLHAMAPEQVAGAPVDHRCDLFAFGVLLYEMLSGQSPFRADSPAGTLYRVVHATPPTLASLRPEIPAPLAELVARLLAKEPEQRPPSIRLVAMRLADLAAAPVVSAGAAAAQGAAAPELGDGATLSGLAPPPAPMWVAAAGKLVPRREHWRLERQLGEGGFGAVWIARHVVTGEPRVFKLCSDPHRLEALQREVTLFRLLKEVLGRRDDIARILDWSFEAPPCYLESEYTEGGDLTGWAESRGGLAAVPLELRLELVAEIAEALAAAHSVGVLHKDVKPANVLITTDREGRPHVRLTDFGIGWLTDPARLAERGITAWGFSTPGERGSSASGTLRYLAPELLEGKPPSIQSDLYSLGVLLYQVVVGDFSRVLAAGWHREIADELLCDDLARIVDGVPERRPASALEIAERLRGLEERRARLETERRARQEARTLAEALARSRRRRRVLAAIAAAAAAVVLLVSLFAWRTVEAGRDAARRRDQAESLIDFMLGDLRPKLEPLGQLALLREVGERARAYFAAVPASDLGPVERRNRARAFYQIGAVELDLGNFEAAGAAFETALELAREPATAAAGHGAEDDAWRFELAQSFFWVGRYHLEQRDLVRAEASFRAYLELAEGLAMADPARAAWVVEVGYAHSNLASVHEARGDRPAALAALAHSLEVFDRLLEQDPKNAGWRLERSHVLSKIGSLRRAEGDLAGARASFEATLAVLVPLAEASPADAGLGRYLATAHNHLGDVLLDLGALAAAREHFQSDLELSSPLAARESDNMTLQRELVVSHKDLGRVLGMLHEVAAAREHLETALALAVRLGEKQPAHKRWQLELAKTRQALAALELQEQRLAPAMDAIVSALALLEPLARASPEERETRLWHSLALGTLGDVLAVSDRTEEARRAWEQAVDAAEPLVREHPEPSALEALVLPMLALDRLDSARPFVEQLQRQGFRRPGYLERCQAHGLCQAQPQ